MTEQSADIALCFNSGSSSLKFALFRCDDKGEHSLASGSVDHLGTAEARAVLNWGGFSSERACPQATSVEALGVAFDLLGAQALPQVTVVGHRVVHGGRAHVRPERVNAALIASLKQLVPLAPLHLPAGIASMEAALARMPNVPHVACFDTAFHAELPEYAARYPLPAALYDEGIRRYGFHGLSYEYILSQLGTFPRNRIIIAHLGSGASLVAIREGRSIDTTMGFTPSGGIPMSTRSGDLDPGLLLYLLREKGYSPGKIEQLIDHESGLLGIAGNADFQTLIKRQADDGMAHLAILMFGYAVRKAIGAYFAALGGLDLLVFTGGIGQHSPELRKHACEGLSALGISLDPERNVRSDREIQSSEAPCRVLVLEADEDRMIARHARTLLHASR